MTRYMVKVEKPQKQEVLEENPGLTAPVRPTLKIFEHPDLRDKANAEIRFEVEKELQKGFRDIDYEVEKFEDVEIYDNQGLVWEGEVKVKK